jgi:streptogramin lyase
MSTAGAVTAHYTDATVSIGYQIVPGPDGALWFVNSGTTTIGRITTGGVISNYTDPNAHPNAITAGPDGALWFSSYGSPRKFPSSIGRITTSGVFSNFTDPQITAAGSIAAGSDGALWFVNGADISRITTAGVVTTYTDPGIVGPSGIVPGPDGALWFLNGDGSIGRITTAGTVTDYTDPLLAGVTELTAGPDGAIWFTQGDSNSLGRITSPVTPAINWFTPRKAAVGTNVTINGPNLGGATQVAFNGTPAAIFSNTANQIVATVPAGATSGPISVTTPVGTATSARSFTVT